MILAFILVPLIEVALFIQVGGAIGTLQTVLLVLALGFLGGAMVRWQGLVVIRHIRRALSRGEIPADELVEGLIVLVCAALLITPGFFTDMVGIIAILPPGRTILRDALKRVFSKRIANYGFTLPV